MAEHKITTQAQLVAAINKLLEYNWLDEEKDYNNWKEENPGLDDSDHIFYTLQALNDWVGES